MTCMSDKCLCEKCNALTVYPAMPCLSPLPRNDDCWHTDCHWMSHIVNGHAVVIRRGFETDLASFPRLTWRVIGHPLSKDTLAQGLAHDALYAAEALERKACDDWFLESMRISGIGWAKRNAIWSAVRIGGGFVWARHDRKTVDCSKGYVRLIDAVEHDYLMRVHDVRFMSQPFV